MMLEICEATPVQISNAMQLLGKLSVDETKVLEDGIKTGIFKAETFRIDGVDRFLLVFHKTNQNRLHINAAAQLTKAYANFTALCEGMVELAKKYGCASVTGDTLRAGVLKKLLEFGFKPVGVTVKFAL